VEGGRTQDLPGVKVTVVRGKYDCTHPVKWLIICNIACKTFAKLLVDGGWC
jgi:hypothetical protein